MTSTMRMRTMTTVSMMTSIMTMKTMTTTSMMISIMTITTMTTTSIMTSIMTDNSIDDDINTNNDNNNNNINDDINNDNNNNIDDDINKDNDNNDESIEEDINNDSNNDNSIYDDINNENDNINDDINNDNDINDNNINYDINNDNDNSIDDDINKDNDNNNNNINNDNNNNDKNTDDDINNDNDNINDDFNNDNDNNINDDINNDNDNKDNNIDYDNDDINKDDDLLISDKVEILDKKKLKYDRSAFIDVDPYDILANTASSHSENSEDMYASSEDIQLPHGTVIYLSKYQPDQLKKIERDCLVKVTQQLERFTISGKKQGIDKAKQKLDELQKKVVVNSYPVEKPGMEKYLNGENHCNAMKEIQQIGYKYQAVIAPRYDDEQVGSSGRTPETYRQKGAAGPTVHSDQLLAEVKAASGVHIKVYQGDMTEHKVDVLVNAANEDLQHIGGLAYAILMKGRTLSFLEVYKVVCQS